MNAAASAARASGEAHEAGAAVVGAGGVEPSLHVSAGPGSHEDLADRVSSLGYEARCIYAIAWAADQILLENNDLTITPLEHRARVGFVFGVVLEKLESLADELECIEESLNAARREARGDCPGP